MAKHSDVLEVVRLMAKMLIYRERLQSMGVQASKQAARLSELLKRLEAPD
jgi:hypothetical protein